MLESTYQSNLIQRLKHLFPGCVILKNDASYLQGIPDLAIFWKKRWAMLEVKTSARAPEQPNQRYYVELLDDMSFAAFIYPAIEEEVLDALQRSFRNARKARVPSAVEVPLD